MKQRLMRIDRKKAAELLAATDQTSRDIMNSEDMRPYVRFAMAIVEKAPTESALAAIDELPLEKRYLWRIASALKWAFCDFDTLSVKADLICLSDEDKAKVLQLLNPETRLQQLGLLIETIKTVDESLKDLPLAEEGL